VLTSTGSDVKPARVVAWGRDYWGVRHYILRNRIEATDGPAIRRAREHGPAP